MYQHEGQQWMQLDEAEIRAIPYIRLGEYCYYYLTRINGDYRASAANNRISNFKKRLDYYNDRQDVLWYKQQEIKAFARDLSRLLTGKLLSVVSNYDVALVPINTSRPWEDEYHDSRLIQLCDMAAEIVGGVRVANVMRSRSYLKPAHTGGTRDYRELRENLDFVGFGNAVPDVAILVDDVLTTGVHYAVCRDEIRMRCPTVQVIGAFLSLQRSEHVNYNAYGIRRDG